MRRDLQRFILFTGLGRHDGSTVRWEHVDFEASPIHRPRPKGGEDRAFTVPVSGFVLDLLQRRRRQNEEMLGDDGGWAFPTTVRRDGRLVVTHVREVKEQRYAKDGRKVRYLPSPHRLRDTFATAGHEARIHPMDLKVLMNHALPSGNVPEGYIRPSLDHLRRATEDVARFLLNEAGVSGYAMAE